MLAAQLGACPGPALRACVLQGVCTGRYKWETCFPGVPCASSALAALPQVWLRTVKYRLAKDDSEGARKALERSLQALPKFEHIRMISQAGLLEFKLGDPGERGRCHFPLGWKCSPGWLAGWELPDAP